jgi:hypothetical protein
MINVYVLRSLVTQGDLDSLQQQIAKLTNELAQLKGTDGANSSKTGSIRRTSASVGCAAM